MGIEEVEVKLHGTFRFLIPCCYQGTHIINLLCEKCFSLEFYASQNFKLPIRTIFLSYSMKSSGKMKQLILWICIVCPFHLRYFEIDIYQRIYFDHLDVLIIYTRYTELCRKDPKILSQLHERY